MAKSNKLELADGISFPDYALVGGIKLGWHRTLSSPVNYAQ
jgi:hypothetical protein